jgi:phosphorylase kinase alpha/beta subunit
VFINFSDNDDPARPEEIDDWLEWRKQSGTILALPKSFYRKLWRLLDCSRGLVLGDRYNIRSRLDTAYIQGAMTEDERSFALLVDGMLNEIHAPEYRYLTVEAIIAIAAFVEVNPGLKFDDYLVIDAIVDHALRLHWLEHHPDGEQAFNDDNSAAWEAFYRSPPHVVAGALNQALERLLLNEGVSGGGNVAVQRTDAETDQLLTL